MAAQPAAQQQKVNCNFVAQDEIWKAHVNQEVVAAKQWPKDWNFMTTKYQDLVKDDLPDMKRVKLPTPIQVQAPPTPISKHIKVDPSPLPVPNTSNKMIGWRSSVDNLKLERYGGYAKPKGSILKNFNWPAEAAI